MGALKTEVFDKLYVHEYFLVNIAENVKKLDQYMKSKENIDPNSELNRGLRDFIRAQLSFKTAEIDLVLRNMRDHGVSRYGVTLDIDFVAALLIDESGKK